MSRRILVVCLFCGIGIAQSQPSPAQYGRRGSTARASRADTPRNARGQWWGLLVAAQSYSPAVGLPNLKCCYHDLATAKEEWLGKLGVPPENVTFLHDQQNATPDQQPTLQNIDRALNAIVQRARAGDGILVMLAGHGVCLNGMSYFCPGDTLRIDAAEESHLLSLKDVLETLRRSKADRKLMIVDACRDAAVVAGDGEPAADGAPGDFTSFFGATLGAQVLAGRAWKGVAVMTSCTAGERAYELPDWKHGAFIYALLEGIRGPADTFNGNNDGVVSLREAACYASVRTKALVAKKYGHWQTPDLFLGESTLNLSIASLQDEPQPDRSEDDLDFMLRTGNELSMRLDYDTAIDAFGQVVVQRPDRALAFGYRAVAYRSKNEYARALPDFQKAGLDMELMVQNPNGAELTDRNGNRYPVKLGQRLLITEVEANRLYVSSVDCGQSAGVQGWIDAEMVGWDRGLVDMYRPVTRANAYSAADRVTRAQEILSMSPYQPPYVSTALGYLGTAARIRSGETTLGQEVIERLPVSVPIRIPSGFGF